MRLSRLFAVAALGALACTDSTAPAPSLQGNWQTYPDPAGSVDLSLATRAQTVLGTGHHYALGRLQHTFAVTGTVHDDGSFHLTLTGQDNTVSTFVGRMVGSDELQGVWGPIGCVPDWCRQAIALGRQPT